MTTKNLGPLVSGYLNPDGRNWETVGFQSGKPILDKELNLSQDLDIGAAQMAIKLALPSGWLTNGFLDNSDTTTEVFRAVTDADTLVVPDQKALVNGWPILVQHTNSDVGVGQVMNLLDIGASPAGAGVQRTDLVILEVWRKLIPASPATDGKSPTNRIWLNGNVKLGATDDATLNPADDILDTMLGSESTKRVQIQYRLRVVQGVDLFSYPYGLDDPVVTARSTPTNALTPDGVVTTWPYVSQSANGDPGLWVAGNGIPSNTLATVDGYMYAVPLMALFRRDSTAFDKNSNHNGGVATPGPSDRPDGYFYDVIVARDVADLRQAVSPTGWDYAEIGEKTFTYLLDNNYRTDWTTTLVGGGYTGHTVLWADEIGTQPGDLVNTGDTPGANFIGQFDCTRRYFSDRTIYEVITLVVTPGTVEVPAPAWIPGATITLTPTAMAQYPFTAAGIGNFLNRAPTGTKILDVVGCQIRSNNPFPPQSGIAVAENTNTNFDPWPITSITGLGTYPVSPIVITLGAPAPTLVPPAIPFTAEPMYIDLLVAYPPGSGLVKTPTNDWGLNSVSLNATCILSPAPPVSYGGNPYTYEFNYSHRELKLQYETSILTWFGAADCNSAGFQTKLVLPERASTLVQYRKNGVPIVGATLGLDGRTVDLLFAGAPPLAGDVLAIDYTALRPMPQNVAPGPYIQFTLYYEARAPQQARSAIVGTSQHLIPRWISPYVYAVNCGSGTLDVQAPYALTDEAFPFPYAYVQLGGIQNPTQDADDKLDGLASVYINGFSSDTGFIKLPAYIGYTPNPQEIDLLRIMGNVDTEGRTYFAAANPAEYLPSAYSTPFTAIKPHRNVLPAIMETTADSPLGPKGMLVGVLFLRPANLGDKQNYIEMAGSNDSAAVFRLPGYPLNRKV